MTRGSSSTPPPPSCGNGKKNNVTPKHQNSRDDEDPSPGHSSGLGSPEDQFRQSSVGTPSGTKEDCLLQDTPEKTKVKKAYGDAIFFCDANYKNAIKSSLGDDSLMRAHMYPFQAFRDLVNKMTNPEQKRVEVKNFLKNKYFSTGQVEGIFGTGSGGGLAKESNPLANIIPYVVIPKTWEEEFNSLVRSFAKSLVPNPDTSSTESQKPMIKHENDFAIQFPWSYCQMFQGFLKAKCKDESLAQDLSSRLDQSLMHANSLLEEISNIGWPGDRGADKFFGLDKDPQMIRSVSDVNDVSHENDHREPIRLNVSDPGATQILSREEFEKFHKANPVFKKVDQEVAKPIPVNYDYVIHRLMKVVIWMRKNNDVENSLLSPAKDRIKEIADSIGIETPTLRGEEVSPEKIGRALNAVTKSIESLKKRSELSTTIPNGVGAPPAASSAATASQVRESKKGKNK